MQLHARTRWNSVYALATTRLALQAVHETLSKPFTSLTGETLLPVLRAPQNQTVVGPVAFAEASTTTALAAFDAVSLGRAPRGHGLPETVGRRAAALGDIGFVSASGCPPGSFRSGAACLPCPKDTYKSSFGDEGQCTPCPSLGAVDAMTTGGEEGAVSEDKCKCPRRLVQVPVSWSDTTSSTQGGALIVGGSRTVHCAKIPGCARVSAPADMPAHAYAGARCPGGGICEEVALPPSDLRIKPGYWRGHPESLTVSACGQSRDRCLGGMVNATDRGGWVEYSTECADGYRVRAASRCRPIGTHACLHCFSFASTSSNADADAARGAQGVRCDVCEARWSRSNPVDLALPCTKCPEPGLTGVVVTFGVVALVVYVLIGSLRASEEAQSKAQSVRSIRFSSNLKARPAHAFAIPFPRRAGRVSGRLPHVCVLPTSAPAFACGRSC